MFLKYLEIQGFKSFPDKVKIEFNKGITGIVGPNGSGKSNISDAIRWVMGEQSIKSLRGGKMEDVIFGGTQERDPVGFAEVSICFDNSEKLFNVEYNEVVVTRRFFRSGEGEYYINRTSCRLKDIHELFMDTGMGRDGYSVIGQGKIDELITSKPEDRRVIFEEASGISKYRYRKHESEKKIEQTQENLTRLLDIISELEVRLDPLKKESEKAKEYLKLKEDLKGNEINLSVNLMDKIKASLEKMKENIENINKEIQSTHEKIAEIDTKTENTRNENKQKELQQEKLNETLYAVKNEIASFENDINVLLNSLEYNTDNVLRIKNEIEELNKKTEESLKEAQVIEKSKEEVLAVIDNLNSKLNELNEAFSKADKDVEETNTEIDECNNKILDFYRILAEKNAELASAKKEVETLKVRQVTVEDDIEISKEDIEGVEKKKNLLSDEIAKQKEETDRVKAKFAEKDILRKETEQKKKELSEKISELSSKLSSSLDKKKMLDEMEKDMEGYNYSVKSVINAGLPGVKIYGVVAKVIELDAKYATAIDAVLGNVLQNIITENESDAKTAIEYLKKIKGGRATFLPISEVKGRLLDEREFKGEEGYISLASAVVNCKEKFQGVVNEILGRTLLFKDVDSAIRFSRKVKYKFKIVTLDGTVINAGGAITGGNLGKAGSFLSRAAQIKELVTLIENTEAELADTKDLFEKVSAENELLNEECDKLNFAVQQMNNELFKSEYNLEHYNNTINSLKEELEELINEQKSIADTIKNKENLEKEAAVIQDNINNEIESLQTRIKKIQDENNISLSKSKEINTEITKLKVDISEAESDKSLLEQKLEYIYDNVARFREEGEVKKNEISTNSLKDSDINEKIETINKNIEEKKNEITKLENLISEVRIERETNEKYLLDYANETKECNEKLVLLAQEQTRVEEKIIRQEAEFGNINSRLWDEYELTYVTAQEYRKDVENLNELQKYVTSVKNKIRALGNVNVNSIEEYAQVNERYEFLTKQRDDLENAKKSLGNIIKEMETLMIKQFTEQLDIINKTFTRVFKELFNGGHAELVLVDEENILTSGVDIIAQPPGKKLQNMTLFSGGEKAIIAIALLFSLLEVRPSPLCVLDEIEAALDDVNVYRFANYLRKISDRSQIAIITHRRGTMEEADVLYGVTMPEKGVSKLLKLDINDIEDKILNN